MVEMMEVFVKSENKYEEVRVIGEYGTFNDPIVYMMEKKKLPNLLTCQQAMQCASLMAVSIVSRKVAVADCMLMMIV